MARSQRQGLEAMDVRPILELIPIVERSRGATRKGKQQGRTRECGPNEPEPAKHQKR